MGTRQLFGLGFGPAVHGFIGFGSAVQLRGRGGPSSQCECGGGGGRGGLENGLEGLNPLVSALTPVQNRCLGQNGGAPALPYIIFLSSSRQPAGLLVGPACEA